MLMFICFSFFSVLALLDNVILLWLFPFILLIFCRDFLMISFFSNDLVLGLINFNILSFFMIFISLWNFFYCMFFFDSFKDKKIFFFMNVLLVFSFLVNNFLFFYLLFEFVFFFMFVFLLGWGKTKERVQASFYMLFYTLVFSLPFLVFLFWFIVLSGVSSFSFLKYSDSFGSFNWLSYFVFMVFVVKLPLFGFHYWLPKAHVEAPVVGSMLLAGVLLKLGGYGLYRFLFLKLISINFFYFLDFLFYLCLFGGLFISMICLRQSDVKVIIAYSSVVHMSFMMAGLCSNSDLGIYGSILMLVSHGFISSFLFLGLNFIYEILFSRSIFLLKGMICFIPFYCFFWFIGAILNMGFPPFMSFFSEILITFSLGGMGYANWFFIFMFFFFCGVYNIYLYCSVSHGNSVYLGVSSSFFSFLYFFLSVLHFFFVILFSVVI